MNENNYITAKNKITIAYAEDERWFREPTVEMLEEAGFIVIAAVGDGKELIKFLEKSETLPDLFLTDLRMPNMNGIELTEEILMRWPDSKVIILTSEIENFYVEEAKRAGAVCFLHKIIDYKNIKRAMLEVYQTGASTIGKLNL
jgi:DNA-binding NarL/FixJ family response regulator